MATGARAHDRTAHAHIPRKHMHSVIYVCTDEHISCFAIHIIRYRSAMDACLDSCAEQLIVQLRGSTQHAVHIAWALVKEFESIC
eukprot:6183461-Pleurochrysis_carterae.AAC.4